MKNKRFVILVVILVIVAGSYFIYKPHTRGPGLVALSADARGRAVIQYLMAPLCSACQDMKPVLQQVQAAYGDQVLIQEIDVQARPGTMDAYGFSVVPSLVMYDPQGKIVFRKEGVMTLQEVSGVLDLLVEAQ